MAFDDPFNTDEINIGNNSSNNFYNFNDDDPAAEFIARERRELGDITGDNDLNSFDEPFSSKTDENILTNGNYSSVTHTGGSISPITTNGSQYQALSNYNVQVNEPEKIRKWREEFSARIEKKDSDEKVKREDMREQAKKEIEDFYKQRLEQLERTKYNNRSNNRTLEDDLFNNGNNSTSNGKVNDWDKITSLCEFNPKTNRSQKDLTRYRSVLLQLKQQPTGNKN